MTTTATETTGREGDDCRCGHSKGVHGRSVGCMALDSAANACCNCTRIRSDFMGSLGIMPEPVAQDLLRQVEAIDRLVPPDPLANALPWTCACGHRNEGFRASCRKCLGSTAREATQPAPEKTPVKVLTDRCFHGLPLGMCCQDCEAAKIAEQLGWHQSGGAGAIPTYVGREGARPHAVANTDIERERMASLKDYVGARLGLGNAGQAIAEMNAEVERARKAASDASREIGDRHSAEWTALATRCLTGVTASRESARLMHAIAEAITLSARQGCELVADVHGVLEGQLEKLFPEAPAAASPSTADTGCRAPLKGSGGLHCGVKVTSASNGRETLKLCVRCLLQAAPASARPPTATAGEVKMDALMSGDPTAICRALWRGEAADDGAHAIAALSEFVHGHVGSGELEDRFAELLSELLLNLGGPRSATA